jgi:hypothetical protein
MLSIRNESPILQRRKASATPVFSRPRIFGIVIPLSICICCIVGVLLFVKFARSLQQCPICYAFRAVGYGNYSLWLASRTRPSYRPKFSHKLQFVD